MDPNNVIGELLEKGQNITTNAVKTTVSDVVGSVSDQIGLKIEANQQAPQAQNQIQQQQPAETAQNSDEENQRTKDMVRDFYSPSNDQTQNAQTAAVTEEQQLAKVRQKLYQELHNDVYYQPLISYEQKQQQVVSKTDQLENQKHQEMQELQQKEADKPPPLAVQRAQAHTELTPGIAG